MKDAVYPTIRKGDNVKTEYEIIGTYQRKSEVIDSADTRKEAQYLRDEYRVAFGTEWAIAIKMRKVTA